MRWRPQACMVILDLHVIKWIAEKRMQSFHLLFDDWNTLEHDQKNLPDKVQSLTLWLLWGKHSLFLREYLAMEIQFCFSAIFILF